MMEVQMIQNESMSSFECGNANKRAKLYFWTVDELKLKIRELKTCLEDNKDIAEFIARQNTK